MVVEGQEHIISVYVYDCLLYLADGPVDAEVALCLLGEFEMLCGLMVNQSKTCLFPMSPGVQRALDIPQDMTWSPTSFKYLGEFRDTNKKDGVGDEMKNRRCEGDIEEDSRNPVNGTETGQGVVNEEDERHTLFQKLNWPQPYRVIFLDQNSPPK
ncbi:hypothetical protein NDU88_002594 [Pleurodeles waltl]|uniref:Reverse transcriptase n=1 Tax=Pleurodeles waltl TaxID=8319 RepID=A0AAV7UDM3_PLEWA|nr:hypothetical protein NDU88_002594 [Pleurodeles waltl]